MGFAADLKRLCEAAGDKAELVVRGASLELGKQMVEKSPVGNPSLWEDNAKLMAARTSYAESAVAYNEANPGKRRMGTSRRTLDKKFPMSSGKGYTGGRFKNNWMTSIGAMDTSTVDAVDPAGARSMGMLKEKLAGWKPGQTIWIVNNLPYAKKLEYGHSKQAPSGVVRISVQNYASILASVANKVKGK